MKIFEYTIKGHYLTGVGIAIGETRQEAYQKVVEQLKENGLWKGNNERKFKEEDLKEIGLQESKSILLFDGDY